MNNIIKELWHGNIVPQSDSRNNSPEMKQLMEYMARHHDALLKTMTDEQKVIFEKFDDCWSEYASLAESAIFEYSKYTILHASGQLQSNKKQGCYVICVANCVTHTQKLRNKVKKGTKKALKNSVSQCFFGRSDRVRTCGIDVPNKSAPIFSLIYKAFRGFLVQKRCFRMLSFALFPRSPKL